MKSASKTGSSTVFAAAITTLSATHGIPSRPQLAWPARLRDVNPSQRPRPVGPGAQPLGEFVEEVAHPGTHDVIDGDPIDAGRPAVCTDLAPSLPEHVAAGDLVIEGVEAAILILLSAAVEHALESTNSVHARGAADGSSRFGTHQSPSHPSRASMKCGPFPMWPAFPTSEYYDPLRLPLSRPNHFPGSPVIGGHRFPPPTVAGPRRLSRVPRTTIRTFNAQYAGGFLSARSWTQSAFRGLRRYVTGSAPSPPARRRVYLTTLAQASLTLQTARSLRPASHPASRPRTGASLPGDPDVSPDRTHTGRPS